MTRDPFYSKLPWRSECKCECHDPSKGTTLHMFPCCEPLPSYASMKQFLAWVRTELRIEGEHRFPAVEDYLAIGDTNHIEKARDRIAELCQEIDEIVNAPLPDGAKDTK